MTSTPAPRITFIGAGNMASAILSGLLAKGYPADKITLSDPGLDKLTPWQAQGVNTTQDNAQAVVAAELVILAVKPQVMRAVCQSLAPALQQVRPLLMSIAAGVTTAQLDNWVGGGLAIARSMPNTPSLLGVGVAGLYAQAGVSATQRSWIERVSEATGAGYWVEEEPLLDAVTAISGSGPAYYFLLTEALATAGKNLGLPPELALQLAQGTAFGAGKMLLESGDEPAELRRKVTSPGGTTEQAIQHFVQGGLVALVDGAAQAAALRAKSLAQELSAGSEKG